MSKSREEQAAALVAKADEAAAAARAKMNKLGSWFKAKPSGAASASCSF